jgi:hypothetical protein
VISQVWNRIFEWLGIHFTLPHSLSSLLNSVAANSGIKKVRLGLEMIWCAIIWMVWSHRNRRIFENGVVDGVALVYDVKVASWKWWIGSGKSSPCLLYEWVAESVLCMTRRKALFWVLLAGFVACCVICNRFIVFLLLAVSGSGILALFLAMTKPYIGCILHYLSFLLHNLC